MQQFRTITSMEEDFKALGIIPNGVQPELAFIKDMTEEVGQYNSLVAPFKKIEEEKAKDIEGVKSLTREAVKVRKSGNVQQALDLEKKRDEMIKKAKASGYGQDAEDAATEVEDEGLAEADLEIVPHPEDVIELDPEQEKFVKDRFAHAGSKESEDRRNLKDKVKALWAKGMSPSEIENVLSIKLDLSQSSLEDLHSDIMTGHFEISESKVFSYVGQDNVEKEAGKPESPESNAGKYVGEGEPEEEEGKPVAAASMQGKYVGDKVAPTGKEVNVIESVHAGEGNNPIWNYRMGDKENQLKAEVSRIGTSDEGEKFQYEINKVAAGMRKALHKGESDTLAQAKSDAIEFMKTYLGESVTESKDKFFIVYQDKASPFKADQGKELVLDGFGSKEEAEKALPKWKQEYDAYIVDRDPVTESQGKSDNLQDLIAKYNATGRIAFHHPKKKTVSFNGGRQVSEEEALKKLKEFFAEKPVTESDNRYVGKDKPNAVKKSPERILKLSGRYVGTKGKPENVSKKLASQSTSGKHIGEKPYGTAQAGKVVPVLEDKDASTYQVRKGGKVFWEGEATDTMQAWWQYCKKAGFGSDHPMWHGPQGGFIVVKKENMDEASELKDDSKVVHLGVKKPFGGYTSLCGNDGMNVTVNGVVRRAYGAAKRTTDPKKVTCPECLELMKKKDLGEARTREEDIVHETENHYAVKEGNDYKIIKNFGTGTSGVVVGTVAAQLGIPKLKQEMERRELNLLRVKDVRGKEAGMQEQKPDPSMTPDMLKMKAQHDDLKKKIVELNKKVKVITDKYDGFPPEEKDADFAQWKKLRDEYRILADQKSAIEHRRGYAESTEQPETLDEAVKVQRLKKMKPAEKAKARRAYRKQKSKIARKLKKLRKKSSYKRRKAKLKRLKKGKKAGSRKRLVVSGLEKIGTIAEALLANINSLQEEAMTKEEMVMTVEHLESLASYMVKQHIMLESDEEEGDDDLDYVGQEWDEIEDFGTDGDDIEVDDEDIARVGEEWDELEDADEEGDEVEDEYEDEKDYVGDVKEAMDLRCMQSDLRDLAESLKAGKKVQRSAVVEMTQALANSMKKFVEGNK